MSKNNRNFRDKFKDAGRVLKSLFSLRQNDSMHKHGHSSKRDIETRAVSIKRNRTKLSKTNRTSHLGLYINRQLQQKVATLKAHQTKQGRVFCFLKSKIWRYFFITKDNKTLHLGFAASKIKKPLPQKNKIHLSGNTANLIFPKPANTNANYFHWTIQMLPRVLVYQALQKTMKYVITNDHLLEIKKQQLTSLGVAEENIYPLEYEQLYTFDKLFAFPRFPTAKTLHAVRDKLLSQHKQPITVNSTRIYISRSNSSRSINNESEVINALQALGFEIFHLENMSFAEQVNLFAHAKVIVAPHGAGLSNIMFSAPGTKVVELLSPTWVYWFFKRLSKTFSLKHSFLMLDNPKRIWGNDTLNVGTLLNILNNKILTRY